MVQVIAPENTLFPPVLRKRMDRWGKNLFLHKKHVPLIFMLAAAAVVFYLTDYSPYLEGIRFKRLLYGLSHK